MSHPTARTVTRHGRTFRIQGNVIYFPLRTEPPDPPRPWRPDSLEDLIERDLGGEWDLAPRICELSGNDDRTIDAVIIKVQRWRQQNKPGQGRGAIRSAVHPYHETQE